MTTKTDILWTPAKVDELKKCYATALANEKQIFEFEGHEMLVSYAKYLIQHLDTHFRGKI